MSSNQRSCLETLLKIIAIIMALGLILSLPIALAGRSLGRVIFRPTVLTAVLRNNVIGAGALEDLLRGNILSREFFKALSEGEDTGRYFEYLSPGERDEILHTLLPPEWIEAQFIQGLKDFFAWLDNDRSLPEISVDGKPMKAILLGGGISSFVDIVVDSWPSCKPEQVEAMQLGFFDRGVLPEDLCEPPEPMRGRVVDLAAIGFEEQVRLLPDSIPLIEADAAQADFIALKEQLLTLRAITLWGWMLPLSLLGLIMAFAIRRWRDFGSWWGIPLMLGGVGTLFLALLLAVGKEDNIASWTSGIAAGELFQELLRIALNAIYTAGVRPLWVQGAVVVLAGFLLWLVARRRKGENLPRPAMDPSPVETRILGSSESDGGEEQDGEPPAGIFG